MVFQGAMPSTSMFVPGCVIRLQDSKQGDEYRLWPLGFAMCFAGICWSGSWEKEAGRLRQFWGLTQFRKVKTVIARSAESWGLRLWLSLYAKAHWKSFPRVQFRQHR